ncbi:carbohydrate kinase family protein [Patescibacteria group bacterium]|nr:carbohydrate kinase family protein [Patescibacteria group bacterium]MBU2220464.1 carbohydrate kinase family protein [Patescibacteria group bacterium]
MNPIVLVGSLAYDRIMQFSGSFGDHFLPEKLHQLSVSFLIDSITQEFGGTAGNIAYNLSLLGLKADIVSTLGTDRDAYLEHLHAHGVSSETIVLNDEFLTAGAYIISDTHSNQITPFAPGAGGLPYAKELDLAERQVVLISPTNISDMTSFVERSTEASVPCFFDPGQQTPAFTQEQMQRAIESSEALFVNDYELALVLEKTGWKEEDILERVSFLVVTLGEKGARIQTKEEAIHIPAVSASAVDPTGAGDAFRAGFLAGYEKGLTLKQCGMLGATLAAYAVESHGGQHHTATREELAQRFTASYGEAWPL